MWATALIFSKTADVLLFCMSFEYCKEYLPATLQDNYKLQFSQNLVVAGTQEVGLT
jgi:hypothetical protein